MLKALMNISASLDITFISLAALPQTHITSNVPMYPDVQLPRL